MKLDRAGKALRARADDANADNPTATTGAIFIGPEFGIVSRAELMEAAREAAEEAAREAAEEAAREAAEEAAREAAESGFDVLIACAFSFDAHAAEVTRLGRLPILQARMNADLHMATDLKNSDKGNLFVIFGEPDITVEPSASGELVVHIRGVDVFDPSSGELRSCGPKGIACWFIDTDYGQESFFVRHAYFLGAADPYKALKTTLKAEINEDAWVSLHSATSRPFPKPTTGRIAVKVINHLGDEVLKVVKV